MMKRTLSALLGLGMVFGTASTASAHIGDNVFLIFEIPSADAVDLDFNDLSVADREDVVGDPSVNATDMFADPTVGEGAQYDPADMDYRIWVG